MPVRSPVMEMEWNRLTFLHWAYEPDVVQALLPEGLEVDTFDDAAWVSLVPFVMVVSSAVGGGVVESGGNTIPLGPLISKVPGPSTRICTRADPHTSRSTSAPMLLIPSCGGGTLDLTKMLSAETNDANTPAIHSPSP